MKYSYAVYQAIFDSHNAKIPQSTYRHVEQMIAKEEAFDAILKSYDEALSEGHMADEVSNIIEKYESGE